MSRDINNPPTKWGLTGVKKIDDADMYYMWKVEKNQKGSNGATLTVWHWCENVVYGPRYIGQSADGHTVVAKDPLHLEPSVYFRDCCGLHGYIREGKWISA